MENRDFSELFTLEALRGEKIHWKINWIMYPALFIMSFMTYRFQDNTTAGAIGMGLAGVNLLYNSLLGYFIYRERSIRILSYMTITLVTLSVAAYNYFDAAYNSAALAATSAAILIYPIIMFLASLRMDRYLVLYSTVLSCAAMDLIYFFFHKDFNLVMPETSISADWISLIFRNVFLLFMGYMIFTVPKSMLRMLSKQEMLMKEKTFHQIKAERDPLTSLYNRYFLEAHFSRCIETSGDPVCRYALLYIDLNDFKKMNDTYGS